MIERSAAYKEFSEGDRIRVLYIANLSHRFSVFSWALFSLSTDDRHILGPGRGKSSPAPKLRDFLVAVATPGRVRSLKRRHKRVP